MHVVSACSLPVASLLWQTQPSTWALTVVCRATFELLPGESVLASDQEDPNEHDDHWDDDSGRSLRAASDLVPLKLRADVTLVGHAFAPGGAPVRSLIAHVLLGEMSKSIEVLADRWVDADGALHEGPPFARMPLVYERAAGGPGTANPVGVAGTVNRFGRIALPNLQPPGLTVGSPGDYTAPVGFGPIAPGWPSRRERLGRAAASGAAPDLRRSPVPDDLDPQFWNHAPRDQQVQMLRERERLILEHLHPDHPRFVTDLPGLRVRAVIERHGRAHPVPLRCDTLWIDTERSLCTLTWRAQVPLEHPEEPGRVVISVDPPAPSGARLGAELPSAKLRPAEGGSDAPDPPSERTGVGPAPADKVLPFAAPSVPQRRRGDDKPGVGAGLPFVSPSSPPGPRAPYTMSPPAIPPPRPIDAGVPPAPTDLPAPRAALFTIPDAPVLAEPPTDLHRSAPKAPVHEGALLDRSRAMPAPVAVAPLTVGQRAAVPVKAAEPRPAGEAPAGPAVDSARRAPKNEKNEGRKALQLVYFEPESLPRVRRKPAFRSILAALEERPLDSDVDDPTVAKNPAAVEDRRDVFEVLARGGPVDEAALEDALDRGVRDDGRFVPPFLLLAGEVRFVFDDLATLRATVSLAAPFAAGDDGLKLALADARELLSTPDLLSPAGLADRFTSRIQDAFKKTRRQVAPAYLEEQVERALLEQRRYQRREVFGAPHLRALLTLSTPARPWPLYLPDGVARRLPMFSRFAARLLVEAHLQEDQFESHPNALRSLAMARLVPIANRNEKAAKPLAG